MFIVYASERPPYPFFLGGAARAAHMLLARIARLEGARCLALGGADYQVTPWRYPDAADYAALGVRTADAAAASVDCGYPIRLLPDFYPSLRQELARLRPDLVWAQLEGALPVLRIAHELGLRGMCFIHDAETDPEELRRIAALNCHLVASSGFLADKVFYATGRRAQVVYPPAELYFDTQGDPDGLVTLINPHPVKGLEAFLEIARRMPEVRFLLQESWKLDEGALADLKERLAPLNNVRFAHRVTEMRQVYRQTRLLLAPSRWEEGFGMVALEAASCGIPVIASRRGGLPEAAGEGGVLIDDFQNPEAYVREIRRLLDDPARYREISEKARRHAASDRFSPEALARRLYAIVQQPPRRPGLLARLAFALRRRLRGAGR